MWQHPNQQVKNFQGIQSLVPFFVQYSCNTLANEESSEEKPDGVGNETNSSTNEESHSDCNDSK